MDNLEKAIFEEYEKFIKDYKLVNDIQQDKDPEQKIAEFLKYSTKIMLEDIIMVAEELQEIMVDDNDLEEEDLLGMKKVNFELRKILDKIENRTKRGEI